jgi:heat shock protein HslJ
MSVMRSMPTALICLVALGLVACAPPPVAPVPHRVTATATQTAPAATDTTADAVRPLKRLSGHYRYMADAAVFVDCASGERLAVAEAGDNLALQRAYGDARPSPGAPMLVTVDGRVGAASAGALRALVVDRFIAITAGPCGTGHSQAQLLNTYWKLTALRGQPVSVAAGQREPHLVLQVKPERVAGFAGCNRLMGAYQVNGDQLRFTGIASTRMACVSGAATEQAFLDALAQVLRWRIDAEMLELFNAQGQVVARFESRYL